MTEQPTQPATTPLLARTGLGFFLGMILAVVAFMVVWPALENHRRPSVRYEATITNRSAAPVRAFVLDATAGESRAASVEPGASAKIHLAIGEGSDEVWKRRIHLLILDPQGVEHSRTAFTGLEAAQIKSIVIGPALDTIEFRQHDGSTLHIGAVKP